MLGLQGLQHHYIQGGWYRRGESHSPRHLTHLLNLLKLQCRVEFNVWIGAEFEWRATESLDRIINTKGGTLDKRPHLLAQFGMELTLTKRRTRPFQSGPLQHGRINECCLTDDAFRPKTYTIRLEQGNFMTPAHARHRMENALTERYALRLLFDKSPYPPRHEWKEPDGGPDANQFWEWKEFAGRESAELKLQAKSSSRWSQCVIC